MLLALVSLTTASTAVTAAYARSLDALFAPPALPTIIPRLIVFCLLVTIGVLAAGLAMDAWRAPARRRVKHGAIWRLLGAPLSNAVVLKPVPPGATAVGNPARVIEKEADSVREAAAAKMGFSAYGITQGDDPMSHAMKGLIDNASGHEHQIAMLWQAIEKLSARSRELPSEDCVPADARTTETFDAERFNRLVK